MYPLKAIALVNNKMTIPRLDQFMFNMEKNFKERVVLQDAKFMKVDHTIC
jgi:hypothetical protein